MAQHRLVSVSPMGRPHILARRQGFRAGSSTGYRLMRQGVGRGSHCAGRRASGYVSPLRLCAPSTPAQEERHTQRRPGRPSVPIGVIRDFPRFHPRLSRRWRPGTSSRHGRKDNPARHTPSKCARFSYVSATRRLSGAETWGGMRVPLAPRGDEKKGQALPIWRGLLRHMPCGTVRNDTRRVTRRGRPTVISGV